MVINKPIISKNDSCKNSWYFGIKDKEVKILKVACLNISRHQKIKQNVYIRWSMNLYHYLILKNYIYCK